MTDLRQLEEKFVSFKTICKAEPDVLGPLSVFGFLSNIALCFDRFTDMEHLAELCFQLTLRDA